MSDLKHWLDETSDADEFERSILRAGLEADPSPGTQERIWSSLLSALPVAPLVVATASSAVSAKAAVASVGKVSTVWLAVAKGFIVGLAVYGATAGMTELANRLAASPAPAAPSARLAPRTRATSAVEHVTAQPTKVLDEAPAKTRSTPQGTVSAVAPPTTKHDAELPAIASFADAEQPSRKSTSQLDAETRTLRRARAELRSGDLAAAQTTLEASQRQFSVPELYQEREALMIELLSRSGQKARASERARLFLGRFPESPHTQQVRQFVAR